MHLHSGSAHILTWMNKCDNNINTFDKPQKGKAHRSTDSLCMHVSRKERKFTCAPFTDHVHTEQTNDTSAAALCGKVHT